MDRGGRVMLAQDRYDSDRLDPYEVALYSIPEAAHYLRLVPNTLRYWVLGRPGVAKPLIQPAGVGVARLSFNNLIEAFVLKALRKSHQISLPKVREAVQYAERKEGISRLLIRPELRAGAGELFLDRYSRLVNLSRGGQLAMKRLLKAYLDRVVYEQELPRQLFPPIDGIQGPGDTGGPKDILIDPQFAFGQPVTAHRHIRTAMLADRYEAGEQIDELARDYELTEREIEEAVWYEARAAA